MPTVLITGANRGIGLEFARQYAGDGWDVIATVRNLGSAEQLNALGVRVEQLDLNDLDAAATFGERLGAPLDLLISNAGVMEPERAQTAAEGRAWGEMLTTNVIAPYLLARSCLARIAAARGKLVAISSGMGSIGESSGGYVPYRTSKAALNMAWHSLAIDAKRLGIVAAVFDPGWVKTRMGGQNAPLQPEDSVDDMRRLIERLGPEHSGKFLKRDGSEHAW